MEQALADATWKLVWVTVGLVLATLVLAGVSFFDFREARAATREAKATRAAIESSARAAAASALAAAESNREIRMDRQVGALATLSMERPTAIRSGKTATLRFVIRNVSAAPAIGISLQLAAGPFPWSLAEGSPEDWTKHEQGIAIRMLGDIGVVGPGEQRAVTCDIDAEDLRAALTIRLEHSGRLGGQVWQVFDWETADDKQAEPEGSYSWRLAKLWVIPSIPGAEPIGSRSPVG
jgi:hypothetical protein